MIEEKKEFGMLDCRTFVGTPKIDELIEVCKQHAQRGGKELFDPTTEAVVAALIEIRNHIRWQK